MCAPQQGVSVRFIRLFSFQADVIEQCTVKKRKLSSFTGFLNNGLAVLDKLIQTCITGLQGRRTWMHVIFSYEKFVKDSLCASSSNNNGRSAEPHNKGHGRSNSTCSLECRTNLNTAQTYTQSCASEGVHIQHLLVVMLNNLVYFPLLQN